MLLYYVSSSVKLPSRSIHQSSVPYDPPFHEEEEGSLHPSEKPSKGLSPILSYHCVSKITTVWMRESFSLQFTNRVELTVFVTKAQ